METDTDAIDVAGIRKRSGLTQREFAARYMLSVGLLQEWEQGRRRPSGAARVLLMVIDREPDAVERALSR